MCPLPDFSNWREVLSQSDIQAEAREALEESAIFEQIQEFSPLICGSIPLDIALSSSDIDLSCYAPDLEKYIYYALDQFKHKENFYLKIKEIRNVPSVIIRFTHKEKLIELFTQSVPVAEQNGYLHMVTEWVILEDEGPEFKEKLMALRAQGLKTEPAFATLLGLRGDPFLSMLDYGKKRGLI